MAGLRLDNVLIVVDDLEAAVGFFEALGTEVEGRAPVSGREVDRLIALDGTRAEIVSLRTPDGHGRIELDKFHAPPAVRSEPSIPPVNTIGIRRIMFEVDDIEATYARLQAAGAEPVGDVVDYGDTYRLYYVRGPDGIIVGLAERRGDARGKAR